MKPHICYECGKWFPGMGDIIYHFEQEHLQELKNKQITNQPTNQPNNQSPQLNKKNVSTQTSQSSLQSSSISSS